MAKNKTKKQELSNEEYSKLIQEEVKKEIEKERLKILQEEQPALSKIFPRLTEVRSKGSDSSGDFLPNLDEMGATFMDATSIAPRSGLALGESIGSLLTDGRDWGDKSFDQVYSESLGRTEGDSNMPWYESMGETVSRDPLTYVPGLGFKKLLDMGRVGRAGVLGGYEMGLEGASQLIDPTKETDVSSILIGGITPGVGEGLGELSTKAMRKKYGNVGQDEYNTLQRDIWKNESDYAKAVEEYNKDIGDITIPTKETPKVNPEKPSFKIPEKPGRKEIEGPTDDAILKMDTGDLENLTEQDVQDLLDEFNKAKKDGAGIEKFNTDYKTRLWDKLQKEQIENFKSRLISDINQINSFRAEYGKDPLPPEVEQKIVNYLHDIYNDKNKWAKFSGGVSFSPKSLGFSPKEIEKWKMGGSFKLDDANVSKMDPDLLRDKPDEKLTNMLKQDKRLYIDPEGIFYKSNPDYITAEAQDIYRGLEESIHKPDFIDLGLYRNTIKGKKQNLNDLKSIIYNDNISDLDKIKLLREMGYDPKSLTDSYWFDDNVIRNLQDLEGIKDYRIFPSTLKAGERETDDDSSLGDLRTR